ncbi:MAG TPA: hypothetical protein VKE42_07025, partial [Candidatus Cybelea sp.]|nr:hypothetical protein [Candidatus Cybelea sp.]
MLREQRAAQRSGVTIRRRRGRGDVAVQLMERGVKARARPTSTGTRQCLKIVRRYRKARQAQRHFCAADPDCELSIGEAKKAVGFGGTEA